jgi:hypothetical protein
MAQDLKIVMTPELAIDIMVSNFSIQENSENRFFYYYKENEIEGSYSLQNNKKNFFEMSKKKFSGNYVMVTNLEFNKGLLIKPVYFQFALFDVDRGKPTKTFFVKMPGVNINNIVKTAQVLPFDKYSVYVPGFRHVFFRNLNNVEELYNLIEFDLFLKFFKKIKIAYYINPNMSDGDHILYRILKKHHDAEVWCAIMQPVEVKGYKTEIDRFIKNQIEGGVNEIFPVKFPGVVKIKDDNVLFNFTLISHYFRRYQIVSFNKIKRKKKFCQGKVMIKTKNQKSKLFIDNKKDFTLDFYIEVFRNLQFIMPQITVYNEPIMCYYSYKCDLSWQKLYHFFTLVLGLFKEKIRKPNLYEILRHCNELESYKAELCDLSNDD